MAKEVLTTEQERIRAMRQHLDAHGISSVLKREAGFLFLHVYLPGKQIVIDYEFKPRQGYFVTVYGKIFSALEGVTLQMALDYVLAQVGG